MPVNTTALQTQVAALISALSGTATAEDLLLLSLAVKNLDTDRVISVPTINDLPDLYAGTDLRPDPGTIFLIEQYDVPVVAGTQNWLGLDGRVARRDAPTVTAWSWGLGSEGNLGDGTTTNKSSPVPVVGNITNWRDMSIGNSTTAIGIDNKIWSWGYNAYGQLGDGTTINKCSPVSVVGGFTDWCEISAGNSHTIGLRSNGTAWAWGGPNNLGKLGDGTVIDRCSPVAITGGFTDWRQLSAGNGHNVGIRSNGTAWAWGFGQAGQLGDGTTTNKCSPVSLVGGFTDWCDISAGTSHSIGLRTDGTAWAWGMNSSGQLGDGSSVNKSSPIIVAGGFTDWCKISAGMVHNIGLRSNGTAWSWGSNFSGKLGDGTTTSKSSPVSVVGGFTDWCQLSAGSISSGLKSNGSIWSWGRNNNGQLGDNTTVNKSSPVSVVGGFTDWIKINSGSSYVNIALRRL